jgi:large subunit ribosomal protein L22
VPGVKTNEAVGTRAVLRGARLSAYKARAVLDLIRDKPVREAEDLLRFCERDAAVQVGKVLRSAMANAENNDELDPDELFVSACYADEGSTIKRWRPRARGRATRIRKRTCHITVIVSRLPEERLERLLVHRRHEQLAQRARRVAGARKSAGDERSRAERRRGAAAPEHDVEPVESAEPTGSEVEAEAAEAETAEAEATDAETAETETAEAEATEAETAETETAEAEAPHAPAGAAGETELQDTGAETKLQDAAGDAELQGNAGEDATADAAPAGQEDEGKEL